MGREAIKFGRDRSGASPVVGIVLLVGLVAIGAVSVLVLGGPAKEDGEDRIRIEHAESGFVELASESGMVVQGSETARDVDLGLAVDGDGTLQAEKDGRIVITTQKRGTVMDESLGEVEYHTDGGTVAFQGGGVWRGSGRGARMVSAPSVEYRGGTMTVDLAAVENSAGFGTSDLRLRRAPGGDEYRSLSVDSDQIVRIAIYSEYYAAWGRYFEQRVPGTTVAVDHRREAVFVYFGWFPGEVEVEHVLTAYDGSVEITHGNSEVGGDIARDDDVYTDPGSHHFGSETGVPDQRLLDPIIQMMAVQVRTDNLNAGGTIDEGTTHLDEPGRYYADGIHLENDDEIVVDLSQGNVTLVVDGDVTLDGGDIEVVNAGGDRAFRIYTTGDLAMRNSEAYVKPRGTVEAQYLQVYGTSDMQVGMVGGSTYFEGVVYAPRDEEVDGENPAVLDNSVECELPDGDEADACIVTGNTAVEGAVHAGPTAVKQSTEVHYDPDLDDTPTDLFGTAPSIPVLDHLHVFVRGLTVEDD